METVITEAPAERGIVGRPSGEAPAQVAVSSEAGAASQPAVFERLHALVRKGYVANIGTDTGTERIVLRHLGKAPDLVLHPDGTVEGFDGHRPWHKRHVELPAPIGAVSDSEHLRFMRFLETVPRATLRDRTRPWRRKYVYFPAVLLVLWGICMTITVIILNG